MGPIANKQAARTCEARASTSALGKSLFAVVADEEKIVEKLNVQVFIGSFYPLFKVMLFIQGYVLLLFYLLC